MHKVKLKCPDCEIPIMDKQVNIEKALVKCDHCEGVFSLEEEDFFNRRKPYVVIPRGIEAYHTLDSMEIDVSWRRTSGLGFLTVFTLFWDFIVSLFLILALSSGDYSIFWGMGLHLIVAVGLTYWVIATFVNHTYIFVDAEKVEIEYGPLPIPFWSENKFSVGDFEQIYVERYQSGKTNNQPNYSFKVMAKVRHRKTAVQLIKGLKRLDHAQYIEQEIEHFLKIKDEKVRGEFL